jgi:hypothetical protein
MEGKLKILSKKLQAIPDTHLHKTLPVNKLRFSGTYLTHNSRNSFDSIKVVMHGISRNDIFGHRKTFDSVMASPDDRK